MADQGVRPLLSILSTFLCQDTTAAVHALPPIHTGEAAKLVRDRAADAVGRAPFVRRRASAEWVNGASSALKVPPFTSLVAVKKQLPVFVNPLPVETECE